MTIKARQLGAISTVLAFALCHVAVGQVVRKDTGRALDSNLRLGSGGINAPVGRNGRIDTQLLINRQSTGLSSFRAGVPYKAANELRLELPSAGLGDFRRQSIGLGQVIAGETMIGGGSLPGGTLPTRLVAIGGKKDRNMAQIISRRLRSQERPVIGRISDDVLLLDPRSVFPEEDEIVLQALRNSASGSKRP